MTPEIAVLRALLGLSRRRSSPSLATLAVRVGAEEATVRRALFSLAKSGLIQRTPAGLRLTLGGLAVAVAVSATKPKSQVKSPRRQAA
jgi:DNA-binding IclR family transcriptional regulator